MAAMHALPPPVRVTLTASRLERAWVVGLAFATAIVALMLPVEAWLRGALAGAPLAWALVRLRVDRRAVCICVGLDRVLRLETSDGRVLEGRVSPASYVGAAVTTIAWQPDGFRVPRAFWILGDMLPREDFRRLRVALRYGQSGAEQDAPRSHA